METFRKSIPYLRAGMWALCAAWTGALLLFFWLTLRIATSAIQEAATGAMFAVPVIAGYVVCRAVGSILNVLGENE